MIGGINKSNKHRNYVHKKRIETVLILLLAILTLLLRMLKINNVSLKFNVQIVVTYMF